MKLQVFRKEYKGKEKEMMSSERAISVEFLVTRVTRMPYKQAYKTLVDALKRDEELLGILVSSACFSALFSSLGASLRRVEYESFGRTSQN